VFSVAVSVIAIVVVVPVLARLLLPILVSSAVVVSAASFNNDFSTAGPVGFVVTTRTAVVDFDTRSLHFLLPTGMTKGCGFLQDQQLFAEICVCVWNLDLGGLLETSVSFEHLPVLHVHSFGDAF